MEIGALIAIGKAVFSPLVNGSKWAWRHARRARFRLEERKPPLHKIDAIRAARSTLGGNIIAAVPFRNLGSKNIYIATARRNSDEDWGVRIVILEQAGSAYSAEGHPPDDSDDHDVDDPRRGICPERRVSKRFSTEAVEC